MTFVDTIGDLSMIAGLGVEGRPTLSPTHLRNTMDQSNFINQDFLNDLGGQLDNTNMYAQQNTGYQQ